MSIYNCPNCGQKTFNPFTKAMAGQLNSKGKACPNCGKHITNGTAASVFSAIFSVLMFILVVATYLLELPYDAFIIIGAIVAIILVPKIVNAFFFKMEPTRRKDALSK
ncbi:MAG: hypothetical protein IKL31_00245 [Ruminococcus sp.]|nr:hypothetical protein [Ruminococcus sp.]MBO5384363.1 hypothetical protein [Ruminococcus sp.]MBR6669165.1 hypothetical protein [Ruminococcus sp.]